MMEISLCMIVKNEEGVLERCLNCAKQFADEIIIVDTGSSDRTIEIALSFTDNVHTFEWIDDFSAARNFSFSKATKDYIMWLDADDIIDDENIGKIIALKEELEPDADIVMMKYHTCFDEAGRVTMSYFRERLVRRAKGCIWREPVHEHLEMRGKTVEKDIAVTHKPVRAHYSSRNYDIYRKNEKEGKAFSTRALFYYAREAGTHGAPKKAQSLYKKFLRQPNAWIEDRLRARLDLARLYMNKKDFAPAVNIIMEGFGEAIPRAEACCKLGDIYLATNELEKAAFWYSIAMSVPRAKGWGFYYEDYSGFTPMMQLCVVHYRLGNMKTALLYHNAAKAIKPDNPAVRYNEEFFNRHDAGHTHSAYTQ